MGCPCIVAAYNGLLRALDTIHGKSEIGMGCDLTCRDRNGGPAIDGEADVDTGMTEEGMELGSRRGGSCRSCRLPVAVKDNCLRL